MTDEEAKKEHDEIQKELAEEKGGKPEDTEEDEDPKEEEEEADEEPEEEDESDEEEEPDEDEKSKDMIPLSKYQDTKKSLEAEMATLEQKVKELTDELGKAKTAPEVNEKIKAFAEKHDFPQEAITDLYAMLKEEAKLDPKTVEILKETENNLKIQKAKDAFESEFSDLLGDFPEAKEAKSKLQKLAYKPENLQKSLMEIYYRQVRPTVVEKKKGAESSNRSGGREVQGKSAGLDFKKIADDIRNNVPNTLGKLSPEDQDKFFEWADKNGSRYFTQ